MSVGSNQPVRVPIPRRAVVMILSVIAGLLLVAHMLVSLNRFVLDLHFFAADNLFVLFDMWSEVSIPSWYSVVLLLIASAILAVIAVAKYAVRDSFRLHWAVLAVIFLALSLDEAADIHGQASYTLNEKLNTSGFLAYAWIIPAALLVLVVGLAYLRFLLHLPPDVRIRVAIAGAVFLSGALVMEAIEGRYDSSHGVETMTYRVMVGIEETLEMAGTILFISTLLAYLASLAETVELRIRPD
ncbi:MAG: hypothetical protein M9890_08130 [Thermomicrobiales bacterium]|nr:hypothetical protein [Thermomicrobiales bacterium]